MDAWELLIQQSSAPAGSDAWTHLNSIEGNELIYVLDQIDTIVAANPSVDVTTPSEISVDVLVPEEEINVVDPDAIEITTEQQAITISVEEC